MGKEQELYLGQSNMGEDSISPDKIEPQGISEAIRPTREEGLATQTLRMPASESGVTKINLDYAIPYVVTEVSRINSPFYSDDNSIGLEDKLIGREDILGAEDEVAKNEAPDKVAMFFAQRGKKILTAMEKLHGEGYMARAKAIVRSGKMAPIGSPQGREDMRIVGHLEQSLAGFVSELNSNITPEANNFRQEIYSKLDTRKPEEVLDLYRKGLIKAGVNEDHGYQKKRTSEVVEKMRPGEKISWGFMRDLVKTLSNPEFRTKSKKMSVLAA